MHISLSNSIENEEYIYRICYNNTKFSLSLSLSLWKDSFAAFSFLGW